MDSAKLLSLRTAKATAKISPKSGRRHVQSGEGANEGFERSARGIDRRGEISIDLPNRTITLSSTIFYQSSATAMQALDLFRFSKHLRTSGQFSLEQADAVTEALAAAIINLEDHKIDCPAPAVVQEHNREIAVPLAIFLGGAPINSILGKVWQVFYT